MSAGAGLARDMLLAASLLLVVAVAGVGVVAFTQSQTEEPIEVRRQEQTLRQLDAILDAERYTNNPATDIIAVQDERLGSEQPLTVYRARHEDEPEAAVLTVIAPDGYSGPIELLVAINMDGTVAGVRIVDHQETPGLGDAIEAERSDWADDFRGRALGDPPADEWTVERDGGAFDQFTGATITPRAVVKAVANALDFFEDESGTLFEAREPDENNDEDNDTNDTGDNDENGE